MFFFKLLLYVFDESNTIHQVDALDTLAAVKFVHHLSRAGFVTHDFSVVERCHSSCNFRLDTVVRASYFFGYLIDIPAVIPSCLDNHSFFKCQVLTFSSFCDTIRVVHSVILSVCFWWHTNYTIDHRCGLFSFSILARSFYNAPNKKIRIFLKIRLQPYKEHKRILHCACALWEPAL